MKAEGKRSPAKGGTTHTRARKPGKVSASTGLTPEVQARIVERIRSGVWWVTEAVAAEGYSREAHYYWLREGAKGVEPYAAYARAVGQAKAELEANLLARLHDLSNCGDKHVELKAIQWRLEKLNPKRYGPRVEITQSPTPTREAYEAMTDEELEAEVRRAVGIADPAGELEQTT
jgi:hypothetical protein